MDHRASEQEIKASEKAGMDALRRYFEGAIVYKSNVKQDIEDHYDCVMTYKGKTVTFDIKDKNDGKDEFFWIETLNKRGKPGWLYGEATDILFRVNDGWLMCPRRTLLQKVEQGRILRGDVTRRVKRNVQAYEAYRHDNDVVIKVPIEDVISISKKIEDEEAKNCDGLG